MKTTIMRGANKSISHNSNRRGRSPADLSDQDLESHVRMFTENIKQYLWLLPLNMEDIEKLRQQQQALTWLYRLKEKIKAIGLEVDENIAQIRSGEEVMSMLRFYDLPRPPFFYPKAGIVQRFANLIYQVKTSRHYTPDIGQELGIDQLEGISPVVMKRK